MGVVQSQSPMLIPCIPAEEFEGMHVDGVGVPAGRRFLQGPHMGWGRMKVLKQSC